MSTLFDPDEYYDPVDPKRPVSEHSRLHAAAVPWLERITEGHWDEVVFRVRRWDDVRLDARRQNQVTVRYTSPGGHVAKDWQRLAEGAVLAYGFYDENVELPIIEYMILDGPKLIEAIQQRPGCVVRDGKRLTHHAPGGAEFVVVDVRYLPPDVVLEGVTPTGPVAPVVEQEALGL